MPGKRTYLRLICCVLLLTLCAGLFGGCRKAQEPPPEPEPSVSSAAEPKSPEELFDSLIAELFEEIITSDSITMNYFLADPSAFGIERMVPTLGEVTSPESILKDRQDNQEISDRLAALRYDELRADQQVIFDILRYDLEIFNILDGTMDSNDDYAYYLGAICPTVGVQVQLPVILAEFHFYTVEEIEIYLGLLADTGRYFDDLIAYERERSRRGFFMSEANVDKVIENCESFLEERENSFMTAIFNDKIDNYAGLSDEQRDQFKQRNAELMLGSVMPAYEALLDAMRELRGVGANPGGLFDLPDGQEYALAYLRYKAGTDRTPEQVDALLEEWMSNTLNEIRSIFDKDPNLADRYFSSLLGNIYEDTPVNYLADLESAIARDFPAMRPTNYVVREVNESMQEHTSPAFYLTAALDAYDDNVIYINPAAITDDLSLFTTLAHEGYPGHMYQTVYYLQQSPNPLRTVMGDWGYTEGWATYVEYQSYFYAGLDVTEAKLFQHMSLYDLLFITRVDLGVNALGWNVNRVASFCRELGITGSDVVGEIYDLVTGNPLLYLPYCLGYLEFLALREEASGIMGDAFDITEFHRFLLDFGPAPFPVIRNYMLARIGAQQAGTLAPAA